MKKTLRKITAVTAMSLLAFTQIPGVNVKAADGVATQETVTAKQPKIHGKSGFL